MLDDLCVFKQCFEMFFEIAHEQVAAHRQDALDVAAAVLQVIEDV